MKLLPGSSPNPGPGLLRRPLHQRVVRGCLRSMADLRYVLRRDLLRNPGSRRRFELDRPRLSAVQQTVVDELREHGISFVPFDALVGDGSWDVLAAAVDGFAAGDKVRQGIEAYSARYDQARWKEYIVRRFAAGEAVGFDDPVLALGLRSALLDTVNAFLGLWSKLAAVNVWYTIPLPGQRVRMASQNWHRDPEDQTLVKVFLYFSDVGAGAGPLEYVPESRVGRRHARLWPQASGSGTRGYLEHSVVEAAVGESDIVACTGPRGQFVFCDTSGLHRGGYALDAPRVLAQWVYVSPASLSRAAFRLERFPRQGELSPAARFALR